MSLYDKIRCANCGHPKFWHNGSHKKGRRTMCQRQVGERHTDRCTCEEYVLPDPEEMK